MNRNGLQRALGALVLCLACAAAAQQLRPPASLASVLGPSSLVGQGQLRWFGLLIYDARLWSSRKLSAQDWSQQPFALELEYQRAFRAGDIARRTLQEIERAGELPPAQAERWEGQLRTLLPDVAPGDRVAGVYLPGKGARFLVNGRSVGEIDDAEFARRFFGIWLGPATSEPGLRDALLGQGRTG